MTAIELRNVEKYYGQGIARVHVLSDVNFKAELGKLNLVIGPSGSGKSTFLTIAGGLQHPSEGQVLIDGQEISALSGKQRDRLRLDKIGFVLQSYNLLPYLTVRDQFALVDRMRHGNLSKGELGDLLKDLGIEKLIHKYPGELSGGQNQRVAIARALYTDPQIILADEPTAALDSDRVKVVGQLFSDLAVKHNKAVVVVTHDLRLREFADQVYTIVDGQMAKEERPLGTPA
ncbi:ABC transporter ATP-binding protein [Limosilactobacillus fermentum]|uniref:ABC transporter ATP-binding protein n=1 Tax=Limosilactobacillus fermentum TaxID=1613 RepID=UPI000E4C3B22|nr:ABC transporter ATP-binding protein [Limosilactobacillus fermentum]MCH5382589.1 ABC transporter ATP-binding protein [Limosilactobacillus fermentum]RGU88982.1 ABC transporter ATP-binding protein [Limosilactobacillus fermentum]